MIKNEIIFHIPHSSTHIPDYLGYTENLIADEIDKLTDHATDRIFSVYGTNSYVCPFSRIFCDVERFVKGEVMESVGRGFYYTHTDNGNLLRSDINKDTVLGKYYIPYHNGFDDLVAMKLDKYGKCLIIDCHSYSDIPFNTDLIKDSNRPDICIGTDPFHTPIELVELFKNHFEEYGLSVEINNPYSGTMVNNRSYLKDKRVSSIMIEINRKLYMKNGEVIDELVDDLNSIIKDLFN